MIEARNVSVTIGRKTILSGISFSAAPGTLTAIVGPNGSGKSTLLKAISGELAYEGLIAINGAPSKTLEPWRAAMIRAVLPQATALSFPFTVREVVGLGLVNGRSGVSLPEEATILESALDKVDLAGFAGRFYQELSGGEQQRVQLARVLCQVWSPVLDGQPRWLLLDEPISSLDIRHQLIIMDIARDFAARGGGVVAILHDLNLTAMYADTMIVVHAGRKVADGSPQSVLTDRMVEDVFGCRLKVSTLPPGNTPFLLPHTASG